MQNIIFGNWLLWNWFFSEKFWLGVALLVIIEQSGKFRFESLDLKIEDSKIEDSKV